VTAGLKPCGYVCRKETVVITGAHMLLYSSEPEKVRAIFRDVFGWKHVDAGDG